MNTTLLSRLFKWEMVRHTKPFPASFTKEEYIKSVSMAASLLPDDKPVLESVIETETRHIARAGEPDLMELETVVYWKEQ